MQKRSIGSSFLNLIIPFIGMGIFLVVLVIAIIFLSYIFIIGGIIGLILFGIVYIKEKFFTRKTRQPQQKQPGKTYDADEFK